ncbi:Protein of unknown function [Lactobacillus delbrueckii subsp. bulgaricus]|nr:Protein of unknown function [Lactobacillus delbrueckii subsp. bulgaricus]
MATVDLFVFAGCRWFHEKRQKCQYNGPPRAWIGRDKGWH